MGGAVTNTPNGAKIPSKEMFDSTRTVADHVDHYAANRDDFMKTVKSRVDNKIMTSSSVKAKILIALWISSARVGSKKDFDCAWSEFLMSTGDIFKFVQMLDAPREVRALRSKLERWEKAKLNVRKKKITRIETRIKELEEDPHTGNLTSSMAKRLRKWVSTIPADQLDFYILNYPETLCLWKQLADLCHLSESDFQNPYFLSVVFGKEIPRDTRLFALKHINTENFVDSIERYPDFTSCYSYLRQKVKKGELRFTPANSKAFARSAPLSDLLWFYEELQSPELDDMIKHRLDNGETITSGPDERASFPAKLMERILMLKKRNKPFVGKLTAFAEERLSQLKMGEVEGWKVGILGDCSASMSVAVETASIVSGLLSVGLNAELVFFNGTVVEPPLQYGRAPSNVADVLEVASKVRAEGCTSPAIGLRHYYKNAKKYGNAMDMFVVVTDEEENTPCSLEGTTASRFSYHGDGRTSFDFAQLLKKYKEEINPNVQVVFISFLRQGDRGVMVTRLASVLPEMKIRQYRLDGSLPDLSKFTELLGTVRMALSDLGTRLPTLAKPVETTTSAASNAGKKKKKNKKNK